jgi:hypothetical protein
MYRRTWVVLGLFLCLVGVASAGPILTNGDFETGNLTGWTLSGNTGFTGVDGGCGYGSYCFVTGPVGSLGYLSQTVADTAGQTFLLSFYLENNGGTPSEFQVNWDGTTIYDVQNGPGFGWTQYSFQVPTTGSDTLEFGFQQDPAYWYLDNVVLSPEPGSILLVCAGMAALALLRRKRS